jgi:hypothetical protein
MAINDYTVFITRKAAKEIGSARYFTGNPCKHGHVSERLTINGSCVECSRLKSAIKYHESQG